MYHGERETVIKSLRLRFPATLLMLFCSSPSTSCLQHESSFNVHLFSHRLGSSILFTDNNSRCHINKQPVFHHTGNAVQLLTQ